MQIKIQPTNIQLSDDLHKRIERRIRQTYKHLSRDVKKITLRLHDQRKHGSGIESCCQIQVQTRSLSIIYAEQQSNDIYSAVSAAANRARVSTARNMSKYNSLLAQFRKLKKHKIKYKTLRYFKREDNFIAGLS